MDEQNTPEGPGEQIPADILEYARMYPDDPFLEYMHSPVVQQAIRIRRTLREQGELGKGESSSAHESLDLWYLQDQTALHQVQALRESSH
jgi:hypothetical protein